MYICIQELNYLCSVIVRLYIIILNRSKRRKAETELEHPVILQKVRQFSNFLLGFAMRRPPIACRGVAK